MSQPYHVLFLCKHNASRSLMAEAILNKVGNGKFHAYSAGTEPSDTAHPYTLEVLREEGFDTANLKPKAVQDVLKQQPKFDIVIGLCNSLQQDDELDSEIAGQFPVVAHWHINDSDSVSADSEAEKQAFSQVLRQLSQRLHLLVNLPEAKLEHLMTTESV